MCSTRHNATFFYFFLEQFCCYLVEPVEQKNFLEQFCSYLVEPLPLGPTAEFCASLTDDSTTFNILEHGTFHGCLSIFLTSAWLDLSFLLVLADFWQGLFTLLRKWSNVNQLRASGRNWFRTIIILQKRKGKKAVFCVVFHR